MPRIVYTLISSRSRHYLANRGQVDKRSLLEHLSSVLLSLDEVVDGGCVLFPRREVVSCCMLVVLYAGEEI